VNAGTYTFTQQDGTQLVFNSSGQMTSQVDRNGYATTFNYDNTTHLLTSVTESNQGNPTPRSLIIGYQTGTTLIGSVQDSAGRTVSFGYSGNQLTSSTDINGNTWQYTYDSSNEMTVMKSPLCVATSGCQGIRNVYTNGQVTQQIDAAGRATNFAYSSGGVNSITTITDPNGNVSVDEYANGMLITETKASGTAVEGTWAYSYDPLTQSLLSSIDPNGHTTTTVRDGQGRVITLTDSRGNSTGKTYNSFGELVVGTPPAPDTPTTNTYDSAGNMLASSTPLMGTSQSRTTTFTYGDSAHPGDVTAVTDPNANVWTSAYDAYGNKTSSTDPLGNQTTFTFDLAGRMTSRVTARGNVPGCNCAASYTWTFSYWPSGALHVTTDPLGHTTTAVLDANNNLAQVTDGDGHAVVYGYDLADERISEIDGNGTSQARTLQTSTTATATSRSRSMHSIRLKPPSTATTRGTA
jgi:YD repeat-containing protein